MIMLPPEVLQQVIRYIPRQDLLNLCKSHRVFYDLVISQIYHTIHFLDTNVQVQHEHKLLFDESHSSAVHNLAKFARTLESSTHLRSFVLHASFAWRADIHDIVKPDILRILTTVGASLRSLHYSPATWDVEVPSLYSTTSVDMPYPEKGRSRLTAIVHSLFTVPDLHDMTLRHVQRTFRIIENFNPFAPHPPGVPQYQKDMNKKGTSDVEYLSVHDTKLEDLEDLEEIMLWPRGLKVFQCTLADDSNYLDEYPLDSSQLAHILKPQSASLEQLFLDADKSLLYSGTFGTLLTQFSKLKRISMLRNFLARIPGDPWGYVPAGGDENDYMNAGMRDLYLALPPALEELILNIDVDYAWFDESAEFPRLRCREYIRDVAIRKQKLYPSLQRVVLWNSCKLNEFTLSERNMQEKKMLEYMDILQDFKDVDVEFEYRMTEVPPGFKIL